MNVLLVGIWKLILRILFFDVCSFSASKVYQIEVQHTLCSSSIGTDTFSNKRPDRLCKNFVGLEEIK